MILGPPMKNYKIKAQVVKDDYPLVPFSDIFRANSTEEAEELAEAKFAMIYDDLVLEFDNDELSLQILSCEEV